jgi:Domain of unknown function (DUF4139)/N-terminal domain of unknown function (DUF4140)
MSRLITFLLSSLIILFVFQNLPAQTNRQPVGSKIEKVTVFVSGGQITRTAKTTLSAGKTELVFKDISPNIDKQSIQVKGDGQFTILSVIHQLNHLEEQSRRVEIIELEAQKNHLQKNKRVQNSMLAVYKNEKAMLERNQAIGGQNTGLKTADLREAVDFQRQRMTEVLMKQFEFEDSIARLDSILVKVDKQLAALHQKKDLATSEIIVTVSAKQATSAAFEISYFVRDAGWFATYDLRVKDVSSPIDLAFKANVVQSSGEDWKDVKLTLSTGDPTESGVAPELEPWLLRFGYPVAYTVYGSGPGTGGITEIRGKITGQTGEPLIGATILLQGSTIGTITDIDGEYALKIPPAPATLVVSYVGYETQIVPVNAASQNIVMQESTLGLSEVVAVRYSDRRNRRLFKKRSEDDEFIPLENEETYQPTTLSFEIEVPYTILSDGKIYTVDIKTETVPAIYDYFAVPKMDKDAFLTAKVTDWQDLNLLDGEVNLFFEGAYLGRSLLDTRSAGDTLEISLGRDKGIVVERNKVKEFTSKRFLGGNKMETRAFEIVVKNNKQQPVNITIQDQFPKSTNKDISVEDLKYEGAELDKETNLLTWKFELAPKAEKRVKLGYSVKYPKREILFLE